MNRFVDTDIDGISFASPLKRPKVPEIRKSKLGALTKDLVSSKFPNFIPHITLCYLSDESSTEKYLGLSLQDITNQFVTINELEFSGADGVKETIYLQQNDVGVKSLLIDRVQEFINTLSKEEIDGINVWCNDASPQIAIIDIMDWGSEEIGKKIGAIASKVVGENHVIYHNEQPPPDGDRWVRIKQSKSILIKSTEGENKKKGTCEPGQRADLTGCIPASGERSGEGFKPEAPKVEESKVKKEFSEQEFEQWKKGLDKDQKEAFKYWGGGAFREIKQVLLDPDAPIVNTLNTPFPPEDQERYKRIGLAFKKALETAPEKQGEYCRGLNNLSQEQVEQFTKVGAIIDFKVSGSFTDSQKVVEKFAGSMMKAKTDKQFVIMKVSAPMVPLNGLVHIKKESEFIPKPGASYKVTKSEPTTIKNKNGSEVKGFIVYMEPA